MSESGWTPLFRTPKSTVTKAMRSTAFAHSRAWAGANAGNPAALRRLSDLVEELDYVNPPLCTISDRVSAAVRLVRASADGIEVDTPVAVDAAPVTDLELPPAVELVVAETAGDAARRRLLIAALHYLITPDDLVPDFRPGGYIDDVLLLTWVFGAAAHELEPFLDEPPI